MRSGPLLFTGCLGRHPWGPARGHRAGAQGALTVLLVLTAACTGGVDEEAYRQARLVMDLAAEAGAEAPAEAEAADADAAQAEPARATPGSPPGAQRPRPRPDALTLTPGEKVDVYLRLPRRSALTLAGLRAPVRGGRLTIRLQRNGEAEAEEVAELRRTTGFHAFPLRAKPFGIARLTLSWEAAGEGGAATLLRPAVRTLEAPAPADSPEPPTVQPPTSPPNVILYVVDTLRARNLTPYGYPLPVSPRLAAFADDASLFTRNFAQSSWTRASVASVFTGIWPPAHGANGRDDALSPEALTLAEILGRAGYETAGFITNGNIGRTFGMAQGFDAYRLLGRLDTGFSHHSQQVNDAVFQWLAGRDPARPFFLYIHTMDPHAPYAPPPEYRRRFERRDVPTPPLSPEVRERLATLRQGMPQRYGPQLLAMEPGSMLWMRGLVTRTIPSTPQRAAQLEGLYDGEIAFNDASFGALMDRLREEGLYDRSLILFSADHGEEFFEHRGWVHGRTLYDEQLRVPLVLRRPGQARGERRRDMAQQIDLLPTVLDAVGLPPPEGTEGRSLLRPPAVRQPPRAAFSYLQLDRAHAASIVEGRFKLIHVLAPKENLKLYDLEEDPGETTNLWRQRPVVGAYLLSRLAARMAAGGRGLVATEAQIDPELREHLRALGYLQ